MKIAIGGIATESCTFSRLPTRLEDFRITRQDDAHFQVLYPFLSDYPEVQFVGTLTAKALPGGPVDAAAYSKIKAQMLEHLRNHAPLDGLYLDMHGAMYVAGMDDAEGDWLEAIRAVTGADCLIAASYDLHGNVSERVMAHLDIITGYRTAPHIDYLETRQRAMSLLVRCLADGIRPRKAFVKIPVGLPGEKTSTEWQPGKRIYAAIPPEIDGERVMDVTVQVGYVWADEPRMTACAIAIGQDEGAIGDAASRLAALYWRHRADFQFGVKALSVDDCLQAAMNEDAHPVVISDSGDNPTAGGTGDLSYFLARALEIGPPDMICAAIRDETAVKQCMAAGVNARVNLAVGDSGDGQPLKVGGTIAFIKADERNPQVVLQSGGIRAILTAKRTPFHRRQQFLDLGITPEEHDIIAIKIGYLVPELKTLAKRAYLALSPGAVNQDIAALPYQRITRPCYPFDADMTWSPQVQLF